MEGNNTFISLENLQEFKGLYDSQVDTKLANLKYFYFISTDNSLITDADKAVLDHLATLSDTELRKIYLFSGNTAGGYYLYRYYQKDDNSISFVSEYGDLSIAKLSSYTNVNVKRQILIYSTTTRTIGLQSSVSTTSHVLDPTSTYSTPFTPTSAGQPATKKYVDDGLLNIAPAYSTSSTYSVGDCVLYNNVLYKCTTAITQAEAWTSAHWTQTTVLGLINDSVGNINTLLDEYVTVDEEEY